MTILSFFNPLEIEIFRCRFSRIFFFYDENKLNINASFCAWLTSKYIDNLKPINILVHRLFLHVSADSNFAKKKQHEDLQQLIYYISDIALLM